MRIKFRNKIFPFASYVASHVALLRVMLSSPAQAQEIDDTLYIIACGGTVMHQTKVPKNIIVNSAMPQRPRYWECMKGTVG